MAKLLVVEDDPDVSEILSCILEDEGHEVRRAQNGEEGLAQISIDRPDMVLLDVEMPILDGPGMAYRLFVRNCGDDKIPVILLSGVANLEQVAERVGTPYFLAKPYRIKAVVSLTQRALAERRAPVPSFRAPS